LEVDIGLTFSANGENMNALLSGKPDVKRTIKRLRLRRVDNIKMYFGKMDLGVVDWIGQAQDRDSWRALVNVVMNLRVL
jgi:hypothetical protein